MLRSLLAFALAAPLLAGCGSDAPDAEPTDRPATLAPVAQAAPSITEPYTAAAPDGGTAGLFMTVEGTAGPDTLIGAAYLGAEVVEVHETVETDDGMREMRPVLAGIPVPEGTTVALAPGGYHIMLVNLAEGTAPGDTLDLTLEFTRSGSVPIRVPVVGLDALPRPTAP